MKRRFAAVVGGAAVLLAVFLLVQLGVRANKAYDANAAIRRDPRQISILFDRAAHAGVLGEGWGTPVTGQGAKSTGPAPVLLLPTSTAAGDVDLTLVIAPEGAGSPERMVTVRVGETIVGVWTPRVGSEEALHLTVPAEARAASYQLAVTFDTSGPIRVIRATTRILRSDGHSNG
jgi:hypothetical protein